MTAGQAMPVRSGQEYVGQASVGWGERGRGRVCWLVIWLDGFMFGGRMGRRRVGEMGIRGW